MLLLPLVENAFKYVGGKCEIKIAAKQESGWLTFHVENSRCQQSFDNKTGIGLENLQRRLNLLYPNNHYFQIQADEINFIAELKIPLTQ
ncbi:MAG: hypothetical protein ICV66_10055 [Chitinophagaceae bacterium]|nr:hypothetical protein [Chitinophagaceae bacterium]